MEVPLWNGKRCRGIHPRRKTSGKYSGPHWMKFTRWLMANGFEKCQLCGTKEKLSFDHIVAWANGGDEDITNYAILCTDCNERKSNKFIELQHCVWPHPALKIKTISELVAGDYTMFGHVDYVHYIGFYNEQHIYEAKFSGKNHMMEFSKLIKNDKRLSKLGLLSRPVDFPIYLYPGENND